MIEQKVFDILEDVADSVPETGRIVLRDLTSGFDRRRARSIFELEFDWIHRGRREIYECRQEAVWANQSDLAPSWQALFNQCITQVYEFFDLPIRRSALYNKPDVLRLAQTLDLDEARIRMGPGTATLRGKASLFRPGGSVAHCTAGNEVVLLPATQYASARMLAIYGSAAQGFNPYGPNARRLNFSDEPSGYWDFQKKAKCNSDGFFEFEKLSEGNFYVIAQVIWSNANRSKKGGNMMKLVSVQSDEITTVDISYRPEISH